MSKPNSAKKMKIVWAVDPFESEKTVLQSAAWSLMALAKAGDVTIEPIYVWAGGSREDLAGSRSAMIKELQKSGQKELSAVLARIKIPGVQPFKVIANFTSVTVRQEARELVAYAKFSGAELIVVPTHARKGINRWLLGSFAETLTLYSDVPLLTIHPEIKKAPQFKSILFPTDFSVESQQIFEKVLDFAQRHESRVYVLNKVGSAVYPAFDFAFTSYAHYESTYKDETKKNQAAGKRMVASARARGVRCEVILDRLEKLSVAESILKRAKSLKSMVAMVSHSGPVSTILMGSTTRQVIRYCEQPVWVIHPKRRIKA